MLSILKKPYLLMGAAVNSVYSDYILAFLFYIEAIFFLPTDPILILYCLERQHRALTYALIATVGSVLGGTTSYLIGSWLWHHAGEQIINNPWVMTIMAPKTFYYLAGLYQKYECWAILACGFMPIPYKAATLTAGFCQLSLAPFILCSFIGRGSRFFLLAIGCKLLGPRVKNSVIQYFNLILVAALIIIVTTLWLLTRLA